MSNLSRKSLFLILILVAVLAMGAALAVSFTDFNGDGALIGPEQEARAAITAASSFDKAGNGTKYYYTQPTSTANGSVTINSSASWGSQTNPYVINTTAQWLLFAQVITNQTAGYAEADKVYILNQDLNFGGNTIPEVGRHANGFKGTLYANKHTLGNATIQWSTWILDPNSYSCGLFHYINGGKIYDLNIASNINLTMKADINAKVYAHMGGLASVTTNSTIVGVNSNVSISSSQTGTTNPTWCRIGGIIGAVWNGSMDYLYKVSHSGNLYFRQNGGTGFISPDDYNHIGGIVGGVDSPLTLDQFMSTGTMEGLYCGNDISMVIGKLNSASTSKITVTNGYLYGTVHSNKSDTSPAYGIVVGWDHNVTWNTASSVNNIYANVTTKWTLADGTVRSGCNLGWSYDVSRYTNVYLPATSVTCRAGGVASTSVGDTGGLKKVGSAASVISAANGNTAITNNFSIASNGTVTLKNTACVIDYDLGGGSWTQLSAAAKSYTPGTSKTIAQLGTVPTKAGFTFSKWSFDPAGSTTVNASTNFSSLSGNRVIYAIWTVNGIGNPTSSAVTYGASSVSMSAATHAAVTNNLATISYQWRKGSASGTVLA